MREIKNISLNSSPYSGGLGFDRYSSIDKAIRNASASFSLYYYGEPRAKLVPVVPRAGERKLSGSNPAFVLWSGGADALIAATALSTGQSLFTANDTHYRFIEGLD